MVEPLSPARVVAPGRAWYRGDFHAHTHHSDGTLSPAELLVLAREEGLDFFAVTDHNSIASFAEFGEASGMAILPGTEVSLPEGHFNLFGIESPLDWMGLLWGDDWRTMRLRAPYATVNELMARTREQGLLSSINHPLLKPWEWRDAGTELRYLDCLEIWNDPSWPDNREANPAAVALWSRWLNAGHRITAIGGSDFHRPAPRAGEDKVAERLGLPSTYVLADELSGRGVLDALRAQRAYVSMGPRLNFQAHHGGTPHEIGADLGEAGGRIDFSAHVSGCGRPARLQLVRNGQIIHTHPLAQGEGLLEYGETITPGLPRWYRLDVVDDGGQILAISNPIFTGPRRPPGLDRFGEYLDQP